MQAMIAVLPGDGIGPEVTAAAVRVLRAVADRGRHEFEFIHAPVGGAAIEAAGDPLPDETLRLCRRASAVLFGAIGGPRWTRDRGSTPEDGLLRLRRELGLFANLRPVRAWAGAGAASPLREEVRAGADILFVRELTGGIYFGPKHRDHRGASDTCVYTASEIERVARVACRLAASRRGRLTSVDKANVLETSRLWREVVERVAREEFPGLAVEHMLVDAASMHLLTRPREFDVVVTENMFGDILTDEASVIAGSLGMLASASLSDGPSGLYEPVHGSAPDLAGHNSANPVGAILSAALLLRHSLGLTAEAAAVEQAALDVTVRGVRTGDLCTPGQPPASCSAVAEAVVRCIEAPDASAPPRPVSDASRTRGGAAHPIQAASS